MVFGNALRRIIDSSIVLISCLRIEISLILSVLVLSLITTSI